MKLPAIAGHGGLRRALVPHGPLGLRATPAAAPDEPLTKLERQGRRAASARAPRGIQCVPPLAEAAKHVYVFQRTPVGHRRAGQPPDRPRLRRRARAGLAAGPHGQLPGHHAGPAGRGRPDRRRVDAPLRGRPPPARAEGHERRRSTCAAREEIDYGIMEEHRRRVEELVADPATAEILKPYYRYLCKRPCFHDEYLAGLQRAQRHPDRLPGRHRADHRAGARSSTGSSTRSTASSTAPASSPSSRRCPAAPATRSSAAAA